MTNSLHGDAVHPRNWSETKMKTRFRHLPNAPVAQWTLGTKAHTANTATSGFIYNNR